MRGIYLGDRLRAPSGKPELGEIMKDGVPELEGGHVRTVEFHGPEHILTIGPTRSGKGRRLLAPNLLYDTGRSMVVVDPKGELAQWTAAYRAKHGSEVVALDPFGVLANDPRLRLPSIGYNPARWLNIDDILSMMRRRSPKPWCPCAASGNRIGKRVRKISWPASSSITGSSNPLARRSPISVPSSIA